MGWGLWLRMPLLIPAIVFLVGRVEGVQVDLEVVVVMVVVVLVGPVGDPVVLDRLVRVEGVGLLVGMLAGSSSALSSSPYVLSAKERIGMMAKDRPVVLKQTIWKNWSRHIVNTLRVSKKSWDLQYTYIQLCSDSCL
jgi:hypothetical protein